MDDERRNELRARLGEDEPRSVWQRLHDRTVGRLPRLEREDRVDLLERLDASATWNADFVVMMGLSTALAALGLLLDSTAVVIGAMLVAPLMTPLVGAGMGLVQGNVVLFRRSLRAMSYGIMVALVISFGVGLLAPMYEPTHEVAARSEVNILDLGVALVSGMAAAYASARPNVAATLAGVAIAAALVPPLSVVGLGLSHGRFVLAGLAGLLFATNLVAIILGAALVFRLLGVHGAYAGEAGPLWARRMSLLLILSVGLLAAPLSQRLVEQGRWGQTRPLLYPASPKVREAVERIVAEEDGVRVILIGRSAVNPETGVGILLGCRRPIASDFARTLQDAIRSVLGGDTPVFIVPLMEGWLDAPPPAGPENGAA